MAKAGSRNPAEQLPRWFHPLVEHSESYRFTALILFDRARAQLAETAKKPSPDSAAAEHAALSSMHLTVKALLAARGFQVHGVRPALELVRILYEDAALRSLTAKYSEVLSLKVRGAEAVSTARALFATAEKTLA